jgi:DNA-binding transcriptional MerR regulator
MKHSSLDASGPSGLFSEKELEAIERKYAEGMTAHEVVELFEVRDVNFSEATFRKWVQLGLLPRSKRVGRKGKHQGSRGLYPAVAVRRVNDIKRMMSQSFTVEEIAQSFLRFTDEIGAVDRGLRELMTGFLRVAKAETDAARRKALNKELEDLQKLSTQIVERIERVERQLVAPLERAAKARAFSSGAGGGAGDLL